MYKSLKRWMNLGLQIKPFSKRDGTGEITYEPTVDAKCYAEGKIILVTDRTGAEVVSNLQLYVPGDVMVSELDNLIFQGKEMPVKSISVYYDGVGNPDLRVVYL